MHLSGLFADSEDAWRQGRHSLTSAFSGMKMKMVINKIVYEYYCFLLLLLYLGCGILCKQYYYTLCVEYAESVIRNHYS